MRLFAAGLTCWGFAFLLAAKGHYLPGLLFAGLGALAFIGYGLLQPSDAHRDAWERHHTGPGRRA